MVKQFTRSYDGCTLYCWSIALYRMHVARAHPPTQVLLPKSLNRETHNLIVCRMNRILDIYFVGGFGTVTFLDVATYMVTSPDNVVLQDPGSTLRKLTNMF